MKKKTWILFKNLSKREEKDNSTTIGTEKGMQSRRLPT